MRFSSFRCVVRLPLYCDRMREHNLQPSLVRREAIGDRMALLSQSFHHHFSEKNNLAATIVLSCQPQRELY